MTVAHYFTFLRLALVPLFVLVYLHPSLFTLSTTVYPLILALIMAISELTDAFDGYFARKLNQVTDIGKIIDPMADSLSRLAVYFCFTQAPLSLPLEIPLLMLYRDVSVSTLRTLCAMKGHAFAARWSGKLKAAIQAIAAFLIIALMIAYENQIITLPILQTTTATLATIACAFSLFSGIEYFLAARHTIKRLLP